MYIFGKTNLLKTSIDLASCQSIIEEAHKQRSVFARYPRTKVLELLDHVGKLWSDKNFPARVEASRELPKITGFSSEMIDMAMEHVTAMLKRENLEAKLKTELRDLPVKNELEQYFENTSESRIQTWCPLGVTLHIVSGNVFLAGLGSLVEGLITGNITIVKMSSAETYFLPLFIKTLQSCDADGVVSKSIAAICYSSSQKDVIDSFKQNMDGIVVWGGEQAVQAYRDGLPSKSKLIVFGPKMSLGFIEGNTLRDHSQLESLAKSLAFDISIWDQQACTAPQTVFIDQATELDQTTFEAKVRELGQLTSQALSEMSSTLPLGELDNASAVEIQKWRSVADIEEAKGDGFSFYEDQKCQFSVLGSKELRLEASPLYRTIKIIYGHKLEDIVGEMLPYRGQLQSLGLHCTPARRTLLEDTFFDTGFIRIMPLGQMAGGSIDDPHDGKYDLPELMNLSFCHRPETYSQSIQAQKQTIETKLRALMEVAKSSSYYGKALAKNPVNSLEDLKTFPILTRDILEKEMFPYGNGLQTKSWAGGYVTRSGGSTGEPKFSIYDENDWNNMINHALSVLTKAGLNRGDRLANFMLAGDLYGGFVSFDHINSKLGVTSFSFAGSSDLELFVSTQKQFNINVVQGVPTALLPFLREAKLMSPSLSLEKVIYAGSPMSDTDKMWLKNELKVQRISSVIGANDGGQIAYQCGHLKGAAHHLVEDFNYIEIVDENGHAVSEGEEGRILITSLEKFAFPLIRYDIGDSGRFVESQCECGTKARTIEYLGRTDDTISIGMLNFSCRDLERILNKHRVSNFQVVASSTNGVERIRLKIENEAWPDDLQANLKTDVINNMGKLKQRLNEGHLSSFDFDFLSVGSLKRNPRTGKLKRVVDERIGSGQ